MQNAVAQQVKELYQEYPYPAHGVISSVVPLMLKPIITEQEQKLGRAELRFLDAGCGTGEQTLGVARTFPALEVTGIDLNQASLDLATKLAQKHQLAARFERHSLMEPLTKLGTFDVITSIGVLHSLPEPRKGFEQLRGIANEHTVFMGMVYGSFGKWDLFQVRDALSIIAGEKMPRAERLKLLKESRLAQNTSTLHYVQTLFARRRFGPDIRPWEALRRVIAGRNAAYQADAYTHVQEETYTWGELIDLLSDTGWEFCGWPKRSGMPDDPSQLLKGEALHRVRTMPLREQASVYERLVRPQNLYFIARPK